MTASFAEASADLRRAEKARDEAMRREFPTGCRVQYWHGNNVRDVKVIDHGSGGRLRVDGLTRTAYWIGAERVTHRRLAGQAWERVRTAP